MFQEPGDPRSRSRLDCTRSSTSALPQVHTFRRQWDTARHGQQDLPARISHEVTTNVAQRKQGRPTHDQAPHGPKRRLPSRRISRQPHQHPSLQRQPVLFAPDIWGTKRHPCEGDECSPGEAGSATISAHIPSLQKIKKSLRRRKNENSNKVGGRSGMRAQLPTHKGP